MPGTRFWTTGLVVALLSHGVCSQAIPDRPDPRAEPAIAYVLCAFEKHDVVAIAESHWNATEHAFLRSLISNPELPAERFLCFFRRSPDGTWGAPDFRGQKFGGI